MGMMQMSPVRTHHYAVAEADFEEFTARRATLITAIRAAHPGLTETRLIRQQDGTYTDAWHWDSLDQMISAAADLVNFPQAGAAMSLVKDNVAVDGVVIDQR
jgi:hypothetical protein